MSKFSKHILDAGTRAHYDDADYYDRAYQRRKEDVRFYVDLAVNVGGPVLELGAGSGRVLAEIAKQHTSVTGVELSSPMREKAKSRIAALDKKSATYAKIVAGDLRSINLKKRFRLVISPFNVWMHLYTRKDVERGFATVKKHLSRGGLFVFDVLMPDIRSLGRDSERVYQIGPVRVPGEQHPMHYTERFEYDAVHQVQLVTMAFAEKRGAEPSWITPLTHRQFFPAELEALLYYNGFNIETCYGGFDKSELNAESESQIIVATRR